LIWQNATDPETIALLEMSGPRIVQSLMWSSGKKSLTWCKVLSSHRVRFPVGHWSYRRLEKQYLRPFIFQIVRSRKNH